MKKRRFPLFLLIALASLFRAAVLDAAQMELPLQIPGTLPVKLDADEINFDEISHTVNVFGHAVVKHTDMTLNADRVAFDTQENVIRAYSVEGKKIRVARPGNVFAGTYFEYHINEAKGFLSEAEGQVRVVSGNVYIKGGDAETAQPESAHDWEWVHGKYLKKSSPTDSIVKWNDALYTTCRLDEPHYRFKSKNAVIVPGRVIVLRKPRLYIGKRYIMTLPFNVNVNLGKRKSTQFTILPNYDSDMRYGLEAKLKSHWNTGELEIGGGLWTKGISEYDYRLDQNMTNWMSVYAGNNHHYDEDLRETKDRPFWGMKMERWDWGLDVGWAQREERSVVKRAGRKAYDTTIWRKPEIAVTAPWIGLHMGDFSQYARFKGNWGHFQETGSRRSQYNGEFVERYGWGIDYYTDYPFKTGKWTFSPFFKIDYWNYGYENDRSDRHEITTGIVGFRASTGIWEFGTAYSQRRTSGHSAFGNGWDYLVDEDDIYQRIGVKLGPSLMFSLQAIIDITEKPRDLTTLAYILTYDNSCCTRWELIWHEDKTVENDDNWLTLSFAINAFPGNLKFGNDNLENPFGRPGKLKPRRRTPYTPTLMERDGTLQAEDAEIRVPVFDV